MTTATFGNDFFGFKQLQQRLHAPFLPQSSTTPPLLSARATAWFSDGPDASALPPVPASLSAITAECDGWLGWVAR